MSLLQTFVVPHPPIIIPEIGKGEEIKIKDTIEAYKKVAKAIAKLKPDTIIISTPHAGPILNSFIIAGGDQGFGDFANFGVEQIFFNVEYDKEISRDIVKQANKDKLPVALGNSSFDILDHGIMVPLYFLNKEYKDYKLVKLSISGLTSDDHFKYGQSVRKVIDKRKEKIVYIASGDLSHVLKEDGPYGFNKEGPIFDEIVTKALRRGNLKSLLKIDERFCSIAAECGLRSFLIMGGILSESKFKSKLLSYEGPFGVGYAVASYIPVIEEEESIMDPYVKLAKKSLEFYIKHNKFITLPEDLPGEMYTNKAGVFVTLNIDGQLRGCIGTITGVTSSIGEEIIRNAVSAGFYDPRFRPVDKRELSLLNYSVDVLGPAFPVSSLEDLDAKRFGVIVSNEGRRGLLLPNLEGINTPMEQIEIALQKANISPQEEYKLEAFEVVRHT